MLFVPQSDWTEHWGSPRVDRRAPAGCRGFLPGARYSVEVRREKQAVAFRLVSSWERDVSVKGKDGAPVPIIDQHSAGTLPELRRQELLLAA